MEKTKVTQRQRDNAIQARDVMWPSVPRKNVFPKLGNWATEDYRGEVTCGTVACFGGWCAHWPAFQDQGVKPDTNAEPRLHNDLRSDADDACRRLFGCVSLFYMRGIHIADEGFKGSDHALVTNRLNWLIENSEVDEPQPIPVNRSDT